MAGPILFSAQAVEEFRAPYLIEKLQKQQLVLTDAEGESLFRELKRYLIVVELDRDTEWNMFSLVIDEVWHQFVLFTAEYIDFCASLFGRYLQHCPGNAPRREPQRRRPGTFEEFRAKYRSVYNEEAPDCWYDERSIKLNRRVMHDGAGTWQMDCDTDGTLDVLDRRGIFLFNVNDLALEAVKFIAATGAFYVRELPGMLSEEEKVGLVAALVQQHVLRVA